MGLLRFLFIAIFILWVLRLIARLLMPFLFQQVVKKAQQQAGGQSHQQESRKPEGTIHVDYIPPERKEPVPSDKGGDFVDYEEIK
jgi:hypothetical protein